ncbi:hypothetical protein BD410DRAFT_805845 [Rickenella mellea]|uniref:Uncharacterized protein n=1 Tax=Rickenella mellea TaxID=50990 RepID=A0A4Y7PVL1_9AGAM|nr:hypothetical protein BD410DRAFT_805845 [Rickenella mellea]
MGKGSRTTRTSPPPPEAPLDTPTNPLAPAPAVTVTQPGASSRLGITTGESVVTEADSSRSSPIDDSAGTNPLPRHTEPESSNRNSHFNPPENFEEWVGRDPEDVTEEVVANRLLLRSFSPFFAAASYKTFPLITRFVVPQETMFRKRYKECVELGKKYWGRPIEAYYPQEAPRTSAFRFRQLYEALDEAISPDIYVLPDNHSLVYSPNIEGLKKFERRVSNMLERYEPYLNEYAMEGVHIPIFGLR